MKLRMNREVELLGKARAEFRWLTFGCGREWDFPFRGIQLSWYDKIRKSSFLIEINMSFS
jgi:hypothetical protein